MHAESVSTAGLQHKHVFSSFFFTQVTIWLADTRRGNGNENIVFLVKKVIFPTTNDQK